MEAKIALPKGKGIWPSFWILGRNIDQINWPACGEINLLEAIIIFLHAIENQMEVMPNMV